MHTYNVLLCKIIIHYHLFSVQVSFDRKFHVIFSTHNKYEGIAFLSAGCHFSHEYVQITRKWLKTQGVHSWKFFFTDNFSKILLYGQFRKVERKFESG
jgi:hypothetical protein